MIDNGMFYDFFDYNETIVSEKSKERKCELLLKVKTRKYYEMMKLVKKCGEVKKMKMDEKVIYIK